MGARENSQRTKRESNNIYHFSSHFSIELITIKLFSTAKYFVNKKLNLGSWNTKNKTYYNLLQYPTRRLFIYNS